MIDNLNGPKNLAQRVLGDILQGLHEVQQGKSVKKTAMDIFNEEETQKSPPIFETD